MSSTESAPETAGDLDDTDDIEDLRREIALLHERITVLEDRVGASTSSLPPAASDYRDARVLKQLSLDEVVHLQDLRNLYLEHTDIRDDSTFRDRIKDLVESDEFTRVRSQQWRYLGTDAGGDSTDE